MSGTGNGGGGGIRITCTCICIRFMLRGCRLLRGIHLCLDDVRLGLRLRDLLRRVIWGSGPRSGSSSSSGTGGRVAICDRDSIAWFHEVELEELEELVEVVVAVGVVTGGGVGVETYFFMKISS